MAGPVQRQGQELTGLRRILATPGQMHKHEAMRQQREVSVMFLTSHQSWRGSEVRPRQSCDLSVIRRATKTAWSFL